MNTNSTSVKSEELVKFLKKKMSNEPEFKFTDRLKIVYRPYICPFGELISQVSNEDIVFDIGCGSGQFALLLAEFAIPKKISGVEIDDELVNNARKLTASPSYKTEFNFEKFDGKTLPEDVAEASIIFMIDVFHHIPKKQQIVFMDALYNSMSTGAKLVFKDIDRSSPFFIFNKLHDGIFAGEFGNEIAAKKANAMLKKLGFNIIQTSTKRQYVYPHYTLISEK